MLVGENGAGKTTMLMLLNLFYEDYTGEIFIDDIDIKTLEIQSLREGISMMFQSGSLLPLTLYENIALGRAVRRTSIKIIHGFNLWYQSIRTGSIQFY